MASPKDLKPKIHEGKGLRANETKGRKKKAQPTKIRGLKKKESSGTD